MKKTVLSVCVFLSSFAVLAHEVDVLVCEPDLAVKTTLDCKGVRNDFQATIQDLDKKALLPEIRTLAITCSNEKPIAGLYTGYFVQTGGILNLGMGFVSSERGFMHGGCRVDVVGALALPRVTRISLELKKKK